MPLFLDDEQIQPREFALRHKMTQTEYDRLLKKPIFKLDDSQVKKKSTITANKNLSEPPVQGIKCGFWFKDADGMTKKLVYAESRAPKIEGGVRTWVYKPSYLFLKGVVANFLKKEEDKAVYMYYSPGNPASPFKGQYKMFSFVDAVAETLKGAENMSAIQKALTHATQSDEEELVLLAKGLKLLTSDDYDLGELRLKMQQFAIGPLTNSVYVKAMNDEMTRIEGRIRNCVDKGIMKLLPNVGGGTARQWVWGSGPKEGAPIGEPIMNVNEDALHRLITAIKTDLNSYLYDLRNTTVLIQAERKAREVLEKEKVVVPAHLAEINAQHPADMAEGTGANAVRSLKDEINSVDTAKAFLEKRGYKKTAPEIKQLREAVLEERVDYTNVDLFLASLYSK